MIFALWSGGDDGEAAAVATERDITQRRRQPAQKRSRETFDRICVAASQILIEGGLEALNTNAVADRAGISITAVYSYFPDKFAILHELFLRSEARWREALDPLLRESESVDDYIALFNQATVLSAKARVEDDEYRALRSAVWAVPELAALQEEVLAASTQRLADGLQRRRSDLSTRRARRAAKSLVMSADAAIDDCTRNGGLDRAQLDEVMLMHELYLRELLEG